MRRFFRVAIALYVLCIFVLVASHFAVSNVDVGTAMYLQAPSVLHADRPNAARGIVTDAQTGRMYVAAKTSFRIGGADIGAAATASHGHLHALLRPPANLAGERSLRVRIDHPGIDDFDVAADVVVDAAPERFEWPLATSRLTDEKPSVPTEWDGSLEVLMIPPDGQIARGLPSVVYLLLVDKETQAPVRGTIRVTKVEGMIEQGTPATLATDEMGLVKVPLTVATSVRLTIEAAAEEARGAGTVRVNSVPSQFSIAPRQLLVVPGQPFQTHVATLHRSGGVLVDLYEGARWVAADAFGIGPQGAGAQALVPPDTKGPLVRLQVYQDLFDAGAAWDARWFVVAPSAAPSECRGALRTVLELHETHSERYAKWAAHAKKVPELDDRFRVGRCDYWLEAALLAVPHSFVPAPLLLNTQKDDREELERWRAAVQMKLMLATGGVLGIGFLIVLYLVLQGLRRRQEQVEIVRAVELETATEEDLAVVAPGVDLDRVVLVVQTIIIVLTLFTFGASLIMLMSWM